MSAHTYPCQVCSEPVHPDSGMWLNADGSLHNLTCRGYSSRVPSLRLVSSTRLHPGLGRAEKARNDENSFETGQGWL